MSFSWRLAIIIEKKVTHQEFIFHLRTCIRLNSPCPRTASLFCHFFLHPSPVIKGSPQTERAAFACSWQELLSFVPTSLDQKGQTARSGLGRAWKSMCALRTLPSFPHGTGRAVQGLWSSPPLRASLHPLPLNPTHLRLVQLWWRCRVLTAVAGATETVGWGDMPWWSFLPCIYRTLHRARARKAPKSGCPSSAGGKPANGRSWGWGPWPKHCTPCATTCHPSTAKEASLSPRYRHSNTPSSTSANWQTCWMGSNKDRCHEDPPGGFSSRTPQKACLKEKITKKNQLFLGKGGSIRRRCCYTNKTILREFLQLYSDSVRAADLFLECRKGGIITHQTGSESEAMATKTGVYRAWLWLIIFAVTFINIWPIFFTALGMLWGTDQYISKPNQTLVYF